MTVSYILHSCFVVESRRAIVVFDYWKDRADQRLHRLLEQTEKQVYFVASHFHADHYNAEILRWQEPGGLRKPPLYLLGYDIVKRRRVPPTLPAAVLRPGHGYADECLCLQAYRSTDIGVSTCLSLPEEEEGSQGSLTFFHAGDLNNWYFPASAEDSARLQVSQQRMEQLYLSVLRDIRREHAGIDHLMFPVDPRLGSHMLRGARQWLQSMEVRHFYPMHFWQYHTAMEQGVRELQREFPATRFHCPPAVAEAPELPA